MGGSEDFLLSIHGKDLINLDVGSLSDPYVIVSFCHGNETELTYLGTTETIDNDLNPAFAKSFPITYGLDKDDRNVTLEFYDRDDASENLKRQDFMGECTIALKDLYSSKDMAVKAALKSAQFDAPGYAIVFLEPVPRHLSDQHVKFHFSFEVPVSKNSKKAIHCVSVARKAVRLYNVIYRSNFTRNIENMQLESEPIPLGWVMSCSNDPEMRVTVSRMREAGFFHRKQNFGNQEGFKAGTERRVSQFDMPLSALDGSGQVFQPKLESGSQHAILSNTKVTTANNLTTYHFLVEVSLTNCSTQDSRRDTSGRDQGKADPC